MSDELERTNEVEITCTRDIEDITAEILEAKRAGGEAILTIGRGLIEAKALLAHGEWLPWLTERVEFSERSAQNFMRLAREWSNPQTLADLGASKALALLALPAEERADFIASVHVVDGAEKTTEELSSRELAQAIRERDEARREAEAARADAGTAEAARAKMAADMETAYFWARKALQPTLTPPNEWVSVEERLPKEKQRVIVRCERVGTSVGWILWGNWMADIGPDAGKVTHWMPLPEPPDRRPTEGDA